MKPIIGVVGRIEKTMNQETVTCIWKEIQSAILKKGGIPILLLSLAEEHQQEKEDYQTILSYCDGLLLQGGYEWHLFDEIYYQEALKKNMPILGICLGMQMMASIDCERKNKEDNIEYNQTTIDHHQIGKQYVHSVKLRKNTLLQKIVKQDEIKVNSRHHYHVKKLKNLKVSAMSEDGLIEAIEANCYDFVLGVQWHPESLLQIDQNANLIFEYFIEASKKYHQRKTTSKNQPLNYRS